MSTTTPIRLYKRCTDAYCAYTIIEKDVEREKQRERERERERGKDKERGRKTDRQKDREKGRERERERGETQPNINSLTQTATFPRHNL